ncbi:MAG: universal stress protein [Acidimicrobiales bacterium]
MFKTIVVGYDGTDRAMRAVQEASNIAEMSGGTMHVVTAVPKDEVHDFGDGSDRRVMSDVEIANDRLDRVADDFRHLRVSTAAVEGGPARVLINEARSLDADVIVVGNKNVQGVARVFGSVAEDVAHRAPCAVLIAKTG